MKFKPIGAESLNGSTQKEAQQISEQRSSLRTDENEEEELVESNETLEQQSAAASQSTSSSANPTQTGIAAAGFKKFVKKSISIRINKSNEATSQTSLCNENENSITAETRLLKENKHISKKRSQQPIEIKKIDSEELSSEVSGSILADSESKQLSQKPATYLSESEKLRAQINQYNINNPMQQQQQQQHHHHHHHQQQQQFNSRFPGAHVQPQIALGAQYPGGYIPAPPPSFAIPPPPLVGTSRMNDLQHNQSTGLIHHNQQTPVHLQHQFHHQQSNLIILFNTHSMITLFL